MTDRITTSEAETSNGSGLGGGSDHGNGGGNDHGNARPDNITSEETVSDLHIENFPSTSVFGIGAIAGITEERIHSKTGRGDRLGNIFDKNYSGQLSNKLTKTMRIATRLGQLSAFGSVALSIKGMSTTDDDVAQSLSSTEVFDKYADIFLDITFTMVPFFTGPIGLSVSLTYAALDIYFDYNLISAIRRSSFNAIRRSSFGELRGED
ncbi:hypothetical protein ACFSF3_08775 [Vibrio chagasii]